MLDSHSSTSHLIHCGIFRLIYFRFVHYLFIYIVVLVCCWSLLYSAILRSWADSLRLRVIPHEWLACLFSTLRSKKDNKTCEKLVGRTAASWVWLSLALWSAQREFGYDPEYCGVRRSKDGRPAGRNTFVLKYFVDEVMLNVLGCRLTY